MHDGGSGVTRFIGRRLLWALPTLLLVTFLVYRDYKWSELPNLIHLRRKGWNPIKPKIYEGDCMVRQRDGILLQNGRRAAPHGQS